MLATGPMGNDVTACGVGCGSSGANGDMRYVGGGQGSYIPETQYRYIGHGGDFTNARPRRDFTIIICGSILGLMLLLGALCLLLWPAVEEIDCVTGAEDWGRLWGQRRQAYCCRTRGIGCQMDTPATAAPGPVGPVDPFNCADGFQMWQSDWSVEKKQWCCRIHTKGCGSTADVPAAQYDCQSSLVNFVKAWSDSKKGWCCETQKTGCVGDLTDAQAAGMGYGAGAEYGTQGAPVAAITR